MTIAPPQPGTDFALSGDQWWTAPWRNHDALVDRHVLGEEPGLFIDAPPAVDLARRPTAPLLVFWAARERDAWGIDPCAAYAIAVRAEDHAVRVGPAIPRAGVGEAAVGKASLRMTSERRAGDLVAQLGLDEGTWLVQVVLGAQCSNRVEVALTRSPRGWVDPAVREFIAQRRKEKADAPAAPPPPWPPMGVPWPTYRPEPKSLEVPSADALDIELQRSKRPGKTIALLRGALRRPALRTELIGPDSKVDYGAPRPLAMLAVTLVASGTADPVPRVLTMRVPVYDPLVKGVAVARFAVDLGELVPPLVSATQTLALGALSGTTQDRATLEWTTR